MPLAVKNGQLLGKNGGLCESCCTDPPITGGVLCEEPFGQVDMICAYTKDDALAEAAALEASGDIWCGNFLNNGWSKEPIQDGTSCSGDDNQLVCLFALTLGRWVARAQTQIKTTLYMETNVTVAQLGGWRSGK